MPDPEVIHVSNAEMDALPTRGPHLAELSWGEPRTQHRAAAGSTSPSSGGRQPAPRPTTPFVEEALPFLRARVNDPDDLRLVFWFSG